MDNKPRVRIENPSSPLQAVTSLKRAERMVRNGHAIWVGGAVIRLQEVPIAVTTRTAKRAEVLRITGRGYDALREMYIKHARHIPIIHPEKML